MRRLALLVVPLLLAACGSTKHAASTTIATTVPPVLQTQPTATTSAGGLPQLPSNSQSGLAVAISAPTHTPKVNAPWPYTVRVTSHGKPTIARIYLQVLYQGTPVGPSIGTHLVQHGVWKETIRWPASSLGYPLVFDARAISGADTAEGRFPVRSK